MVGLKGKDADVSELDEMTYLLESGSERIGALDFQKSPTQYIPRYEKSATLDELQNAAAMVEAGIPLTTELAQALFHGTSLGGARPKALIEHNDKQYIAKFSSSTDTYNVVKAEYIAMRLAEIIGLNVAKVQYQHTAGKDVLLVERFDRKCTSSGWERRAMVSALTIFGLDEMMARYASYEELADCIRDRFTNPQTSLYELYNRIVFNILSGNTDDHARNHAAFWDGKMLELTPAYDICPQGRAGNEATQAMSIYGDNRYSQLKNCLDVSSKFLIDEKVAIDLMTYQIRMIQSHWDSVCAEVSLSETDKALFWGRMFLNPFAFENAPEQIQKMI